MSSGLVIFDRDELDLIVELAACSLDEKPGKNWVQSSGGLPEYICRLARAIKRTGKSTSQAIAIAVSRVKKWAAGGDDVDADTRAKAAKAVAEWEKLKAKNKGRKTVTAAYTDREVLCLAKTSFNVDVVRSEFERQSRAARTAWRQSNPGASYDEGPPYLYVKEQWSDYLIVAGEHGRNAPLYKIPYTVDKGTAVNFGEPVQVKTQYVAVPESEMAGAEIPDAALAAVAATDTALDRVLALTPAPGGALAKVLALAAEKP